MMYKFGKVGLANTAKSSVEKGKPCQTLMHDVS